MQWLQNTYTRRFDLRHRLWGRLFGDRYKAMLVVGAGYYYETLLDYLHLNPVRAGLVDLRRGQSVLDYAWSSVAGGHALLPRRRPPWLATAQALAVFGCADTPAGRKRWVERLDDRARAVAREKCGVPAPEPEQDARRSDLRRGWYWGSQAFAERMLKVGAAVLKKPRQRSARSGQEQRAHGEQEARRLLAEGKTVAGLSDDNVQSLPGSDARKVAIARVLWEQTTVDMPWLAAHLHLRSAANASQQIRRHRQHPPPMSKALQRWMLQSRNVA